MKKVFLIFGALVLMSNVSLAGIEDDTNCHNYAIEAVIDEIVEWGSISTQEFYDSYNWYWEACEESGGNIVDPVVI